MEDSDGSDSGFLGGLTIVVVEFGEIGIEIVVGVPLAVLRVGGGGGGGGSGGGSLRRWRHPYLHLCFLQLGFGGILVAAVEDPDSTFPLFPAFFLGVFFWSKFGLILQITIENHKNKSWVFAPANSTF